MRKRDIDIFGMLLGLIIGCILGFFLSSRISFNNKPGTEEVMSEKGSVYLLQITKTNDPTKVKNLLEELKLDGLEAVDVRKGNDSYYIYGGMALEEAKLANLEADYLEKGYPTRIVKENLLDKLRAEMENQEEMDFLTECVENLLNSLAGKRVEISPKYMDELKHPWILASLLYLNENSEENLMKLQLLAYKHIMEALE
jgi:hypothetical protein